jgi:outer membrane receptor protein involved in Fe transport
MPSRTAGLARDGRGSRATLHTSSRATYGPRLCLVVAAVLIQLAHESRRAWAQDAGAPNETTIVAPVMAATTPREDQTAAATVLNPHDSPRATDDLGTLLLEVPGANVTRAGGVGAFTTVSLRGSNPDEVRIYVDGIPLNQAVGGAVDLSTLPLGDVERVEVYRGSAPLAFGESALGGVISISTRTPGTPRASARVGGGSFRTALADASGGGTLSGGLRLYAGLHALRARNDFPIDAPAVAGGYQPANRENNDLSQVDGVVRAALPLRGRRELRAGFIGVWRDQGLAALDVYRATAARAETARALAHLDYESRDDLGANSRLRAVLFGSEVGEDFSDPLHEVVGVPTQTRDRTRALGVRVDADKTLGEHARVSTLLEGRAEQFLPRNVLDATMPDGAPATRQSATAGLELDLRSQRLDLDVLPSARLEATRDVRTGRDNFGADVAPGAPATRALPVLRLGLLRPLGGAASARGNVGYYARIPSFLELYGYNRGVLGNPTLVPERAVNADVGVVGHHEGPGGSVSASATLFGARVEDLIVWEVYGAQTRAQNVSSARVWGAELELRACVRHVSLTTQGTYTNARDEGPIAADHDRQLPHHPRLHGYGRLEWRQPLERAGLVVAAYVDGDATDGNYWTSHSPLPARVLVGAGAAVERPSLGLRLVASAVDVGDSRVQDVPGYPLPGRSFFLTLEWSSVAIPNP